MTGRQIIERALKVIEEDNESFKTIISSVESCIEDKKKAISSLVANGKDYLIANNLVRESQALEYMIKMRARYFMKLKNNEALKSILNGEESKGGFAETSND